jgi:hypothetical protein
MGPYAQEFVRGAARGAIQAPGELLDLALGARTAGAPMSREEAARPLESVPMIPVGHGFLPSLAPQQGPGMGAVGFAGELASPDPLDFVKIAGAVSPFLARAPEIAAWHGSPHKFRRFSTEAIGTGEGAQAYGWGLYFADKKDVANAYAMDLTSKPTFLLNGKEITDDFGRVAAGIYVRAGGDYREAIKLAETVKNEKTRGKVLSSLEKINKGEFKEKFGELYRVDLAPADDDLLDWDLPLSEQSEKVKAGLRSGGHIRETKIKESREPNGKIVYRDGETQRIIAQAIPQEGGYRTSAVQANLHGEGFGGRVASEGDASKAVSDWWNGLDISGENLYRRYSGFPKETSQYLNSLGIPGIRYKDQMSRGKEAGTYNYVIFDDKLVDIMPEMQTPRGTFYETPKMGQYRQQRLGAAQSPKPLLDSLTEPGRSRALATVPQVSPGTPGGEIYRMTPAEYEQRLNAMDAPFVERAVGISQLSPPTQAEMNAFLAAFPQAANLDDASFRRAFEDFRRQR